MKANITKHSDGTTTITVGFGTSNLKDAFKEGEFYRKISSNIYFNFGEVVTCIGFHNGIPYFTSERLKKVNQDGFNKGEEPLPGITLKEEETFEIISEKTLKIQVLEKDIQNGRNLLQSKRKELSNIEKRIAQLIREQGQLQYNIGKLEGDIFAKEIKLQNLMEDK